MDLNNLTFGVPSASGYSTNFKSERFPDFGVLTMHARPADAKKTTYRFELNAKALVALAFKGTEAKKQEYIAFSFIKDEGGKGLMLLVNASTLDNVPTIRFAKQGTFSDKKTHEYLCKVLELDNSKDWYFSMENIVVGNNIPAVKLTLMDVTADFIGGSEEDKTPAIAETATPATVEEVIEATNGPAEDPIVASTEPIPADATAEATMDGGSQAPAAPAQNWAE